MKDQIQQVQDAILEIEMDLTRMRHLMAQLKAKERAFDQRFSSRNPLDPTNSKKKKATRAI